MSHYVFLGGAAHGKQIWVDNNAREWMVPSNTGSLSIEQPAYKYETYIRTPLITSRRHYTVYILEGEFVPLVVMRLTDKEKDLIKLTYSEAT